MVRRWNWDFEEDGVLGRVRLRSGRGESSVKAPGGAARSPIGVGVPPPAAVGAGGQRRRAQVRRRRLGAALLLLAALAVALTAALSGSRRRDGAPAAGGASVALHRARSPQTSEPESDQREALASVLAYTPFVRHGGSRGSEVAITFDDGPGPYTPAVLSVLERMHVHATFFAIGRMERYFSASTVREIEAGDAIGDHTEDHPALAKLSAHAQHEQLLEGLARIELLGGRRPVMFRPPYGSFNATTMRQLKALHLLMVLWSVDTSDYAQPGVPTIVQRALAGAQPGAIILMHDGGGNRTQTVEALPLIIRGLRARGLNPVTVPRLLTDDPPPAGEPLPSGLGGD